MREVTLPSLQDFTACNRIILGSEAFAIHRRWLQERPGDYAELTRQRLLNGAGLSAADYIDALRWRGRLIAETEALKRELDLMQRLQGHEITAFDRSIDVHVSRIRAAIDEVAASPQMQGFEVKDIFLQGDMIRFSLEQVMDSGLQGGVLAFFVLLTFLRRIRLTLIIAASMSGRVASASAAAAKSRSGTRQRYAIAGSNATSFMQAATDSAAGSHSVPTRPTLPRATTWFIASASEAVVATQSMTTS